MNGRRSSPTLYKVQRTWPKTWIQSSHFHQNTFFHQNWTLAETQQIGAQEQATNFSLWAQMLYVPFFIVARSPTPEIQLFETPISETIMILTKCCFLIVCMGKQKGAVRNGVIWAVLSLEWSALWTVHQNRKFKEFVGNVSVSKLDFSAKVFRPKWREAKRTTRNTEIWDCTWKVFGLCCFIRFSCSCAYFGTFAVKTVSDENESRFMFSIFDLRTPRIVSLIDCLLFLLIRQ